MRQPQAFRARCLQQGHAWQTPPGRKTAACRADRRHSDRRGLESQSDVRWGGRKKVAWSNEPSDWIRKMLHVRSTLCKVLKSFCSNPAREEET